MFMHQTSTATTSASGATSPTVSPPQKAQILPRDVHPNNTQPHPWYPPGQGPTAPWDIRLAMSDPIQGRGTSAQAKLNPVPGCLP